MYTSLDWLNELVPVKTIELEDLINKLTLGGFEVEEILEIDINQQNKKVLDISSTANRADSLSIKGIAKEITALLDKPAYCSNYTSKSLESQKLIQETFVPLNTSLDYSTFVSVTIENLTNLTVPKWITEKLICSKIEPSNTLVDFQTYVFQSSEYRVTKWLGQNVPLTIM